MDVMLYSGQCVIYFHIEQIFVLYFYVVISNIYSEGNIKMEILWFNKIMQNRLFSVNIETLHTTW
jgi:hypothetical protein